jgi:DNA replication initiation complex subunit (GINS family)|tara:strand:+ start:294 stop:725 length:432 start_codon:yes stop_codon:yes gene_type:complete
MATAKVEAAKKVLAKAEELFRKQFSNRALKNRKELKKQLAEESARKEKPTPRAPRKKLSKEETKKYLETSKQISELKQEIGKKGGGKYLGKDSFADNARKMKTDTYVNSVNPGYKLKKGGMVKKCRMDGIALRGKTRAKQRSK